MSENPYQEYENKYLSECKNPMRKAWNEGYNQALKDVVAKAEQDGGDYIIGVGDIDVLWYEHDEALRKKVE